MAAAAVALLASCGPDESRQDPVTDPGSETADLVLELTLGDVDSALPEYQFASIQSILPAPDGTLWVLDGDAGMRSQTPQLRQFDTEGVFLRLVGRVGSGPGEYRAPFALGLTRDGRVALRDYRLPGRITFYTPDGELDEIWTLGASISTPFASSRTLDVDTAGIMWLRFSGTPRNRDAPSGILRVRPDGTVLDTVARPPVPAFDDAILRMVKTLPSGGTSTLGLGLPYQPYGTQAWSPAGHFAVTRTDQYRIEVLPPLPSTPVRDSEQGSSEPWVISRDVPLIPVPGPERAAARQRLQEQVREFDPGPGVRIPDIPEHKPPIKYLRYGSDRRLWVEVSMPSHLQEDEWTEPTAYDVFSPAGAFLGRVVLPDSFQMHWMEGDHIWGVYRDLLEVESIRRYRIVWPSGSDDG